jgi:Kdo2-lipid IVA lauroyltransferase/acyltransferase
MARQNQGVRARVEYIALLALKAALARVPLERAARLGAASGRLAMAVDRINRPIALCNLEIAFPEKSEQSRLAILLAMYRNFGRMAAEWVHFGDLTRGNIDRFVTYGNKEYWDEAVQISGGRGVLAFTGHFGNFELLNAAHSLYGNPIAFVYRPLRNPYVDAEVAAARIRFGGRVIPRQGAGREVLRTLHDNWMVCIPIDLDVRRGVFVEYFSKQAATTDAVARVALASGAPVLPAFMVRDGATTRHRITLYPPIRVERGADRDESARDYTQRFTRIFEEMVRRHPDHWNWIHRRWKTRPAGEQRFY